MARSLRRMWPGSLRPRHSARTQMFILHFSSMTSPRLTARLLGRGLPPDAHVVLDLEDGLQNVLTPADTPAIKAQARLHARAFFEEYPALVSGLNIGFRINARLTDEFDADIETLRNISQVSPLDSVVLTKVASGDDFEAARACLDGVRYRELIPLIETVSGIDHLEGILDAARTAGAHRILYGHFDFSADANHWPFLDQDRANFWAWIEPLIDRIEASGLEYVHTPFPHVDDDTLFELVLSRLARHCGRPFGASTLSLRQTKICASFVPREIPVDAFPPAEPMSEADAVALAIETRDCYEAHWRAGLSFAVAPRSGRFVPPQEYLAAQAFLQHARPAPPTVALTHA